MFVCLSARAQSRNFPFTLCCRSCQSEIWRKTEQNILLTVKQKTMTVDKAGGETVHYATSELQLRPEVLIHCTGSCHNILTYCKNKKKNLQFFCHLFQIVKLVYYADLLQIVKYVKPYILYS